MVLKYAAGTPKQREMVQDALNRYWWPSVMMLGPHDSESPNTPQLVKWGVKTKTNDEVRQEFIAETAPELIAGGLTIPDPDLHQDADGVWHHGPIDWDEFWQVVKGNGPCNAERLGARVEAHADGAWVREALVAYSEKKYGARAFAV